jgi:proliferating cell nuclear antigen PCNA
VWKKRIYPLERIMEKYFVDVKELLDEKYFHIQGLDSSHVCLYDIILVKEWFDEYIINDDIEICFVSSIFSQILSFTDTEIININNLDDKIELKLFGNKYEKLFNIPLIENELNWMEIPKNDYDSEFSINTKLIQDFFSQLIIFGDTITINCNETEIYLICSGENGEMKIKIEVDDLIDYSIIEGENIEVKYSLKYIQKTIFTKTIFENINFSISKELPLKISYSLENSSNTIDFYIAPKIEEES